MRFVPLFCLVVVSSTLAAPVPKETEKQQIEKKFGKIVDPKGDSKFTLDSDKLVITLPANETRSLLFHDSDLGMSKDQQKLGDTVPRVERAVEGDFSATVRVTFTLDPKAKANQGGAILPFASGGIQLAWPEEGCCFVGAAQKLNDTKLQKRFWYRARFGGGVIWSDSKPEPPDAVWVRLERTGKDAQLSQSIDGKEFAILMSNPKGLPDGKLTIALSAHHSSDKAHTVTFDEFKVEEKK